MKPQICCNRSLKWYTQIGDAMLLLTVKDLKKTFVFDLKEVLDEEKTAVDVEEVPANADEPWGFPIRQGNPA